MRLKSALRRGVAAAVIAGIVVSSGIPAYAIRWDIADGDITVKAGDTEGKNRVSQGEKENVEDTDTVITGKSEEHTVTIDTSKGDVDVTFDDLKIDVSGKKEGDGSGDGPARESKAAVTVKGGGDATIELDGDNELKSGGYKAGLEKNGDESSGKLTIKDDKGKDGSLTAEGGEGGAGIGGGTESTGSNITIRGGTIEAVGGSNAAGIGDGAGRASEIDPDAPPSNPNNPNNIIICGDAEVTAKAGSQIKPVEVPAIGGSYGEVPTEDLSDDEHKVTGGSLTRYDSAGKKMEDYSYDRRTPSQTEQPDDTENSDDEDDTPSVQVGEVPDRVKQMYETVGVITHPDGTQELGNVATAEYDPVNKVLSFDAHSTLFRMTGDSLRELAKEVHELRIRFLDGEGREMEAVIPLARIKDLVGVNGAFELELSQEGLYRFHVIGQTGYDRKTFSDETALRRNGRELILVYRVGDGEQKAQETARVEEAIARRKQEKKQWGTVLSGRESSSLSGLPELTQPGTGTVGSVTDFSTKPKDPTILDMGPLTVRPSEKPASDPTVWKTFTGNIVKLVGGKQDSKKDDPAPSVGDLSGLTTLSPDDSTTAQQPETGGWVTDSKGDLVWKPGKDGDKPPDLRGNWETRKWMGSSDDYWWEWQPVQEGDQLYWKPILQTRIRDHAWGDPFYDSAYWKPNKWVTLHDYDSFLDSARKYDSAWMYDYEG